MPSVCQKKLREFEDLHCSPKSTITFKKELRDKFFMDYFEILKNTSAVFLTFKKQRPSTSEYINPV